MRFVPLESVQETGGDWGSAGGTAAEDQILGRGLRPFPILGHHSRCPRIS